MTKTVIRKVLDETNQAVFNDRSISLDLLKNHSQVIPTLAHWLYEEWHPFDKGLTKESLVQSFKLRLNDNQIPFTLVLLKNEQPIGVISVKEKEREEFQEFVDGSPWIGSLQIIEQERNKGLGEELLNVVKKISARLGHQKLLVYTSNPHNVKWYVKRGAQTMAQRSFHGHEVTVMKMNL